MRLRRLLLVCIAVSFAAIDLVHKSLAPAEFHHARTPFIALIMATVIAALVVLVPRVPSNAAACGAGIACGGALGNLVSLLAWSQGVPDPLVISGTMYGVAFNLADLFAVTGDALLLSAVVLHGIRRGSLHFPESGTRRSTVGRPAMPTWKPRFRRLGRYGGLAFWLTSRGTG